MSVTPRSTARWLQRHPEVATLPVGLLLLASLGFSFSVSLLELGALLVAAGVVFVGASARWSGPRTGAELHLRLVSQVGALAIVAYATGWGAALSLVFVVAIADNVRQSGSGAARLAFDWSLVAIAGGQLAVQLDIVPSLIEVPAVHGVAVLGALVLGIVASRVHLLTSRMEDAEAEVSARERRFRALVARSSDATFVIDADGTIRYQSPSTADVLGIDEGALVGAQLVDIVHPEDRVRVIREAATLLSGSGRGLIECRLRRGDGRYIDVESNCHDRSDDPDVGGVVVNTRDVSERKQLEAQLHHRAFHDELTGLANRHLFRDRVSHAVSRAQRHPSPFAVLFLDLDGFKGINDTLGHQAGDALLQVVAERVLEAIRDHDTAARLGGDEFAILVEDLTSESDAARVAERILAGLREPIEVAGATVRVDCSIGIAINERLIPTPESSTRSLTDALLRDADIAMYIAKGAGKGRYEIFEPSMHVAVVERLQLERDLQRALEEDQLVLHYQPIVTLSDAGIVGVEALLRWEHPTRGTISPATFIPLAEETGLIVPIGRWVVIEACRQVREWQQRFPDGVPLRVSVNVSPTQLQRGDVTHDVATALALSGLDPACLTLEITESALLSDTDVVARILNELKALGVSLAVDDFGTGYSSLAYLQNFPFDVLKIDRSFIDGLTSGAQSPAVVRAIVELGRSLHLDTVAEGIEFDEQLARFRDLQCNLGQGFLFARPAAPADLEVMLADRAPAAAPTAGPMRLPD
ncbi:MAG: EAL domain-containing protein [Actinobacteria bacterium]|nr:EAL domain-containing protein [Actinomycetota bacterium]